MGGSFENFNQIKNPRSAPHILSQLYINLCLLLPAVSEQIFAHLTLNFVRYTSFAESPDVIDPWRCEL